MELHNSLLHISQQLNYCIWIKMYQRMIPFAREFLRMNPTSVLIVINYHRRTRHIYNRHETFQPKAHSLRANTRWAWPTCTTSTTLSCKPNASCCCPTEATWFIRDTLVFVHALSDVSSFVLTAISNENRELSHTTPEAATRTLKAATLRTLLLPKIWGVLVLPN